MKYSSVALTPNEKSAGTPLINGVESRNIPAHMVRSLEKARDFRSADRKGNEQMKGPYDVQTYSTPMLPPINNGNIERPGYLDSEEEEETKYVVKVVDKFSIRSPVRE